MAFTTMDTKPNASNSDRPPSYASPDSADLGPPPGIRSTSYFSKTSHISPLTGTFVIDPYKPVPGPFLSRLSASKTARLDTTAEKGGYVSSIPKNRPNLRLESTEEPIDVVIWLVENHSSSKARTNKRKTQIEVTQTKDKSIIARINRPCPSLSWPPNPFTAHVRSCGPVHLSIPRNYRGPLIIRAQNNALLSADVQSEVTAYDEEEATSDGRRNVEGDQEMAAGNMTCFIGDWNGMDNELEGDDKNGEEETTEDTEGDDWKYDEIEVSGSSVFVQFVNEVSETAQSWVSNEIISDGIGSAASSTPTSGILPCPIQSSLPAGNYRIRSFLKPELYVELQDDDLARPMPLDESNDGQKWKINRSDDDSYEISNLKGNRVLSIKTSGNKLSKSFPGGEHSNHRSRWTIEPRLKACIIGISDDERVLDLSDGKYLVFSLLNSGENQRWLLESIINANTLIADGNYAIRNRSQGGFWNACGSCLISIYCNTSQGASYRGQTYLTWAITHDTNGDLLLKSSHALKPWAAAGLKGSQIPVPWRCIPESPGSEWYYLTTDMTSVTPQVATAVVNTSFEPGLFTELKEGDQSQMWEFIRV